MGVPKALLESVLFDFDLFRSDDEYVWSERLLRTMNKKEELSKERRDAIAKRWSKESETGKKENTKGGNVPQSPFVTDTNAWAKLGLKVALKEAVAQGAERIAWTTGEQQNERYDLSKQVIVTGKQIGRAHV